ncbi:MAG: exodeoxyribonuclease VII small subunit [Tannerella sp.]|jgi:exodeoxyribonuclease VII small subunit|nr:exodeoxyribonuclease VII small subunit [Tannerella sp.]
MNEQTTYTQAFEELKGIVSDIDRKEISVDELAEKVRKAAQLIKICKAKLDSTEEDVNRILKELEAPPTA